MATPSSLPERIALVRETIAQAQARGGWSHEVTLVAVTKTHPAAVVQAAVAAGLTDVGENRVQEALEKQDQLRDLPVRWHLIGTLQRNKAKHAVGRFALIHSVDRLDLASELSRRAEAAGPGAAPSIPILIQVNCSAERQKGGVEPGDLPALLEQAGHLPLLEIRGLMTMAAFDATEPELHRTFALLRTLRDAALQVVPTCTELSMGMSGDYATAVQEGATMVRLGSALFGERA